MKIEPTLEDVAEAQEALGIKGKTLKLTEEQEEALRTPWPEEPRYHSKDEEAQQE